MIEQIKKILYATDFSKNSSYVFLYAANIAKKYDARIVILHAIDPLPPYVFIETIENYVKEFCKKAEPHTGIQCLELVSKIIVRKGPPAEEILKAANEEGCDVIILGTHGKGFLAQAFLGSVANSVLHQSQKPVYIIPLPSDIDWHGF